MSPDNYLVWETHLNQLLCVKDLLIFGTLKMHNTNLEKFHHYRLIETTRNSHFNKRTTYLLDQLQVQTFTSSKNMSMKSSRMSGLKFSLCWSITWQNIFFLLFMLLINFLFYNLAIFTISSHLSDEAAHLLTLSPHLLPA